jgi:uncharacterized protein YdiU (UPF0061 family)
MLTANSFNWEYSYLSLPEIFYSLEKPGAFAAPHLFLINEKLCDTLCISKINFEEYISVLGTAETNEKSFAQAYAGHQFGSFTNLGDGRAIVLGEHLTPEKERFDIQLKGSGRTMYSRRGDGKATLRAMLREYLISEALFYLKIPTSRSLAVIKTGVPVYRETLQEGAALVRVMKSHIRVGTFEYAACFCSRDEHEALANYTIQRLYPEIMDDENPVLSLLNKVMINQIQLVGHWMRAGFIHGVMNTDNTAISGETFDYGPCAFMNTYHPETVFSSIDYDGRYAFANQPQIVKWNLARFAEALLPIIHIDEKKALELAQNAIDTLDVLWNEKYYEIMGKKIGIEKARPEQRILVDDLLNLMQNLKMDYTNTFYYLSNENASEKSITLPSEFNGWLEKWRHTINNTVGFKKAIAIMQQNNPVYIPRNHLVERALDEATNGNIAMFQKLLEVWSRPYNYDATYAEFMKPPDVSFDKEYRTFCGT